MYTLLLGILSNASQMRGQEVVKSVLLESIEIRPGGDSIPLPEVIDIIMQDTSYYQSFRETRNPGYFSKGHFEVNIPESPSMEREAITEGNASKAWYTLTKSEASSKIVRRDRYKYLTARMFDQVFFSTDTFNRKAPINRDFETNSGSRIDQFENQLKQLLFNPGAPIPGVPFMSERLAIFSPEMLDKYHFEVWNTTLDGVHYIGFKAKAKEQESNETVIKELTTMIDENTMAVKSRRYRLAFDNVFLEFDLEINTTITFGSTNYISSVKYNGYFDIPFSKPENVTFNVSISKHD